MSEVRPHPANVSGDYFVEDECCLTCDQPFHYAPDLFAWFLDAQGKPETCYVKKQPETPDEVDRMFEVIRCAEASCINYRGCDRAIQQRLVEAGEGSVCLGLPADLQQRSAEVLAALERQRRRPRSLWRRLIGWLRRVKP